MSRRRGDAPPDHPLDTHDTGRDHITGPRNPQTKDDGLHYPARNRVETAATPSNTIERTAP